MTTREELRESLLSMEGPPTGEVAAAGKRYTVRGLTIGERDEAEALAAQIQAGKRKFFRAFMIARCVVDETGARLFSDADIKVLASKAAGPLEPIVDKALKLSGMTAGDLPVEEATEDFGSAQGADSPSE